VTTVSLYWPDYELFPYEREFAIAEAKALLAPRSVSSGAATVVAKSSRATAARRLTYFRAYRPGNRTQPQPTIQHLIETETSRGARRQSTRYSVHGLHEYKGKFNPQVARALLNSACLRDDAVVLDPFCGSGTTLVECAHAGLRAVGTDINPLAAMIANAKAAALVNDPEALVREATAAIRAARRAPQVAIGRDARAAYLRRWFDAATLARIEALRQQIDRREPSRALVLRVVASNLLREFSLQEPADLRIRRRKSPPSIRDLYETFLEDTQALAANVRIVQRHLAKKPHAVEAHHGDTRRLAGEKRWAGTFDAAITSPPYAMALPYIDTQRLSLVWLGLVEPGALPSLQAELIGSREFNGSPRTAWERRLSSNADGLPADHAAFCGRLLDVLGPRDGFRRQAVPSLLYRYLAGMRDSFRSVRTLLRTGAPFFLIVGHNHTVLGGRRNDIPTPELLAQLAPQAGFAVERTQVLQTYQRYGLHQKNAIATEELLLLRAV
jgi:site-specific DNA-methyltransferase (cytosine-N4-specific)